MDKTLNEFQLSLIFAQQNSDLYLELNNRTIAC